MYYNLCKFDFNTTFDNLKKLQYFVEYSKLTIQVQEEFTNLLNS